MPPETPQTNLIAYWRATELFAPQPIPKPEDETRTWTTAKPGPLPWEEASPLREQWIGDKQAWQHVVYCGTYSLDQAFEDLRTQYPKPKDQPNERPSAGRSALAAFVVADDGRPLLKSAVMASCAWALSKAASEGIAAVGTGEFARAAETFRQDFEEMVEADEQDERAKELAREGYQVGAPLEKEGLEVCRELIATLLKLEDLPAEAALRGSTDIRIVSRKVSAREAYQAGGREFLNSFYAEDLRKVGKAIEKDAPGRALREYMTEAHAIDETQRIDVEKDLKYVRSVTAARKIPSGRWPSASKEKPGLGQQLAINTITTDRKRSLWAVNGPPGTGKTVMLRDLIAAVVVDRATNLAELKDPKEAFKAPLEWPNGRRKVHPLKGELTGYELVLACATNAAAENVSAEIPAVEAIDGEWRERGQYFAEVAGKMLNGAEGEGEQEREAWAMIAAVLGSRQRNKKFVSKFWFEGLKEALEQSGSPEAWQRAVGDFREAQKRVRGLREERAKYSDLWEERESASREAEESRTRARQANAELAQMQPALRSSREAAEVAANARRRYEWQREEHRREKPGVWERLRTLNRAMGEWRREDRRMAVAEESARGADSKAAPRYEENERQAGTLSAQVERCEAIASEQQANADELKGRIERTRGQWEAVHPKTIFPDGEWEGEERREVREREAPWIDAEFNQARTELFITALALQKAFMEGAKRQMRETLTCATELISGQATSAVKQETAKAAWQALFMVVPLVSTTFASFPYLFRHLEKEAIGWLLIDEAGQATPQAAVGAIWRAKRAVVVGDRMQLEPIVQLPKSIEGILRREHKIDNNTLQEDPSVQTLADQIARAGTHRGDGENNIWVGTPLNVHRRCEEPMFAIVNEVAYENQMINCTPTRRDCNHQQSHWIDVTGSSSQGNWIPAEGEALNELLEGLRYQMADFKEVFVITPFRDVARQIAKHRKQYEGITTGTIHTAQGREADIVILMLGGNPRYPRARAWAAEKPNLLNVAVSRARRRIYVIGDREAWSKLPHFETLAAVVKPLPVADWSSPARI